VSIRKWIVSGWVPVGWVPGGSHPAIGATGHLVGQHLGGVDGEIGYDHVCAGPLDGCEAFHHVAHLVNEAYGGRALDLGVFPRHLIGGYREREAIPR
jgi:hypothetical protein